MLWLCFVISVTLIIIIIAQELLLFLVRKDPLFIIFHRSGIFIHWPFRMRLLTLVSEGECHHALQCTNPRFQGLFHLAFETQCNVIST